MKDPAEHYAEAERHLGIADESAMGSDSMWFALRAAQVHATLATIDPDVLWPERRLAALDGRPEPWPDR